MRARSAATVAAAAALACVTGAAYPANLTSGAGNAPKCGADERALRDRLEKGYECEEDASFPELDAGACSDWCISWDPVLFNGTEVNIRTTWWVCDLTATVPCCARFMKEEREEGLAYVRAIPYSVTEVDENWWCRDIKYDVRCPDCADVFVDGEQLSCKSYDVPDFENAVPGPDECGTSSDRPDYNKTDAIVPGRPVEIILPNGTTLAFETTPPTTAPPSTTDPPKKPADDPSESGDGSGVPVAAIGGGVAGVLAVAVLSALLLRWRGGKVRRKHSESISAGGSDGTDAAADDAVEARMHSEESREGMLGGADIETPLAAVERK